MTKFSIESNGGQLDCYIAEQLTVEEMADLLKIIAIVIHYVPINEALLYMESLRDRSPFFECYPEEKIS